ncbi:hypothetical protein [Flaviaesturariibacter aridisoli]|uniref:Uncharacterized protein n=1 Tax=Flaviaesturariibacter aridisoli TaxID=2545761 RepID=A0A4R4DYI3_9BACT|nr:hypothetical protein [Flaviaesturariibacter aridisoli]TCZ68346.1 hypothetical protein E0486_14235 [Flaviaesturariibacter aridisoli]
MGINIFDGGASIRIVRGDKTLLITKEQIKAIDTIHDTIVRIDNGEGPLRNIFLDYREVNQPEVGNAEDLRDIINQMLVRPSGSGGGGSGGTCELPPEFLKLIESIVATLGAILNKQDEPPIPEPTRIDEANPNMIYKGWHGQSGQVGALEWAIERITRVGEEVVHEWAYGCKRKIFRWSQRQELVYRPFDYTNPYGPSDGDLPQPRELPIA